MKYCDNNDDDRSDDDNVNSEASSVEPTKKQRKKTERYLTFMHLILEACHCLIVHFYIFGRIWHWVKQDLPDHVNPENHLVPEGSALNAKSPFDMFMANCGKNIFEALTLKSNRYRQQVGRSRFKVIGTLRY